MNGSRVWELWVLVPILVDDLTVAGEWLRYARTMVGFGLAAGETTFWQPYH